MILRASKLRSSLLSPKSCDVKLFVCRWMSKKYSKTLNLPKTRFPLSMKDGVTPKREIEIQKKCSFSELYSWQQQQDDRTSDFILHDGPPYANGQPHVGHALNKILKDITNRYKLLQGYKVHYKPGWDCHGVPIEQKALAEIRKDHTELAAMDIRNTARKFATKTIRSQAKEYARWGVMADWNKGCYFTFDPQYEANQLEVFYKMFEKGLIYQEYMPVFWSPSSRTALAEAELEYNENHESQAVHVKFPLESLPEHISTNLGGHNGPLYAIIWTTTPWTLPANKAICYGAGIMYCFVQNKKTKDVYLVCEEFLDTLKSLLGAKLRPLHTVQGSDLKGVSYCHPLTNEKLPFLSGNHVTVAKGTGLVHTAPAHGPEDFQVAVNHQLSVDCIVDEAGVYTEAAGPKLSGLPVLQEGNTTVLNLMESHILHSDSYVHSYPYDWRTKEPVILRASCQWFVNTGQIKEKAVKALLSVNVTPKSSERGMHSHLDLRTYWCISRQRAWGVPIPVFYHKDTGKVLLTRQSIDHLKDLFGKHGSDAWWSLSDDELLPKHIIEESGFDGDDEFIRGEDVLDIWFDSGSSWAAVLNGDQADVYLEGLDQFGGWFQSSLLTSVAVQDKPPFKNLVVHGFTMDEDGRKMSKSVGNVVDPKMIINGGKDRETEPAYGADVLRWWVTRAHLDSKVLIGPNIMYGCNEQLFRVRKALRYLLANLKGFSLDHQLSYKDLLPQDKYILHQLGNFMNQVTEAYDTFAYNRILILLEKFVSSDVSSFHCHISKDRLYCSGSESLLRRSGQTVQYLVLEALTKCIAPITPHLAEEIYLHWPFDHGNDSVFKTRWFQPDPAWQNPDIAHSVDAALNIRDDFFTAITEVHPENYDLVIIAMPKVFIRLKKLQSIELTSSHSPLNEIMQSSTTSLMSRLPLVFPDDAHVFQGYWSEEQDVPSRRKEDKYMGLILPAENHLCERCRRYTAKTADEPCQRCMEVLTAGWEL